MAISWKRFCRSTRPWRAAPAIVLALLLAGSGQDGSSRAAAASLPIQPHLVNGVRILSASIPTVWGYRLPGDWALVRLTLRSDITADNALVSIRSDQGSEWESAVNLRNGDNEVDLLLPDQLQTVALHYLVKDAGRILAAGDLGDPQSVDDAGQSLSITMFASWYLPSSHRNAPRPPHTEGIYVGDLPDSSQDSWGKSLSALPVEEMQRLGMHAECLSHTHLIVLSTGQSVDSWRSLPGIHSWMVSGGILVGLGSHTQNWTPLGRGGVFQQPGELSTAQIHRLLLASANNLSLLTTNISARTSPDQRDVDSPETSMSPVVFWPGPMVFPGVRAPGWALLGILSLYLLLLIPLNYLALRRLGRKEASWITIPVLVLAFAVTVYGVCRGTKGGSTQTVRFSVLKEEAPGEYTGLAYTSIFAPQTSSYEVTLPGACLPTHEESPADQSTYAISGVHPKRFTLNEAGSRTIVRDFAVPQWYAETLKYSFDPAVRGVISGTASYTPAGNSGNWDFTAANHTNLSLEDCWISAAGDVFTVGSLAPGNSRAIHQAPITLPDRSETGDTVQQRLRLAEGLRMETQGVYLLGWCSAPLQDSQVSGCRSYQDETLVIVPLSIVAGPVGLAMPDSSLGASFLPHVHQEEATASGALLALRLPAGLESNPRNWLVVEAPLVKPDSERSHSSDSTSLMNAGVDGSNCSRGAGGYPGGGYPGGGYPGGGYPATTTSTSTAATGEHRQNPIVYAWNEAAAKWQTAGQLQGGRIVIPVSSLPHSAGFPARAGETTLYLHCPGRFWSSDNDGFELLTSLSSRPKILFSPLTTTVSNTATARASDD